MRLFHVEGVIDANLDLASSVILSSISARLRADGADVLPVNEAVLSFEIPPYGNGINWTLTNISGFDSGTIALAGRRPSYQIQFSGRYPKKFVLAWACVALMTGLFMSGSAAPASAVVLIAALVGLILSGALFWLTREGLSLALVREVRALRRAVQEPRTSWQSKT